MANFIRDRKQPRVKHDKQGNTTTQHWNGRRDVNVRAKPIRVRVRTQENQ